MSLFENTHHGLRQNVPIVSIGRKLLLEIICNWHIGRQRTIILNTNEQIPRLTVTWHII